MSTQRASDIGTDRTSSDVRSSVAIGGKLDMGGKPILGAFDPTATLAVHCGNDLDADFSPYQSTRLIRKDASSRAKG